jgi:hypothetical protein
MVIDVLDEGQADGAGGDGLGVERDGEENGGQ